MKRSARIEINLEALAHNLSVVRSYSQSAKIIAVIKANAYGHGMLSVARHLHDNVEALAVACIEEATLLREKGFGCRIVVLQGFHNQQQLQQCLVLNLEPVCHQRWQADLLAQHVSDTDITVWLKIDTGMNRLGIAVDESAELQQKLQTLSIVNELKLMTHFANADDKTAASNQLQLTAFNRLLESSDLEASMSNSAAILSIPGSIKDWVRPGLMLYGVSPFSDQTSADLNLRPVMVLKSHIIAIKTVGVGESIGYGSCWTSQRKSQVAVVAIGYGDGYPRHAGNGTPVMINGHVCPLVGRVSMDMITVDITDFDNPVAIGDEVELWGEGIDVAEVAANSGTIAYELLCNTGKEQ